MANTSVAAASGQQVRWTQSLTFRLISLFLLLAIVPLAIISVVAYTQS